MLKIYTKYILKRFYLKFALICLAFLSLGIILNIFEEISFFSNQDANFFLPYILTFLNAPITLFEIFPFIFLISAQFYFYEIIKNDEIILFKNNGLSNLRIIKNLFFSALLMGIIIVVFYYNLSSKLKFLYTDIKNNYSNDNKYLAVVNDSGIWLKDEYNSTVLITKSKNIKNNYLNDVIINEFTNEFKLIKTIQANKVNIENKKWLIYEPIVTVENISSDEFDLIEFQTNFDNDKIRNLFSNFKTLDLLQLFNLKKDYEKLGYSYDEIEIHIYQLFISPYLYGLMTVLSSVIMINIRKKTSIYFNVILGIFISVLIYYLNFLFVSLGNTGKIPPEVSVFLPILFITIIQSTWIPHEEKKLAETFGDDWKNYSTKTKKWLW